MNYTNPHPPPPTTPPNTMLRHKPAYYRSRDPVHNLKIKVSIRKIHSESFRAGAVAIDDDDDDDKEEESSSSDEDEDEDEGNSSDEDDDRTKKRAAAAKAKRRAARKKKKELKKKQKEQDLGDKGDPDIGAAPWEAVFSWQEKEFSPREILLYRPVDDEEDEASAAAQRKRRKRSNIVERGYEHELATRPKDEREVNPITCHLFTYTDKDGFVPEQSYAPATGSATGIMHVGQALVDLPRYGFYGCELCGVLSAVVLSGFHRSGWEFKPSTPSTPHAHPTHPLFSTSFHLFPLHPHPLHPPTSCLPISFPHPPILFL